MPRRRCPGCRGGRRPSKLEAFFAPLMDEILRDAATTHAAQRAAERAVDPSTIPATMTPMAFKREVERHIAELPDDDGDIPF